MSTLVGEVGVMAAENVNEILAHAMGSGVGLAPDAWSALTGGGWHAITSDAENGMELRDILEVARVTGRYTTTTPLVTTLLAGRWFSLDEGALDAGVTVAIRRGDETVAPFWSDAAAIVDGEGALVSERPADVDAFALAAPVAVVPGTGAGPVATLAGERLAEARAAFLAIATGCADAVVDRAVDWAQTREQFGQPIKGFQAVRHHLANAHIAREQAWTAANAAAHDRQGSARWARQGFALARRAIELGIQVHGGVGFTWELGLQHYLNQVVQFDSFLGDH